MHVWSRIVFKFYIVFKLRVLKLNSMSNSALILLDILKWNLEKTTHIENQLGCGKENFCVLTFPLVKDNCQLNGK